MDKKEVTIKGSLKSIHESAFSDVKALMPEENVCSVIEFVTVTLKNSKDLKEATKTLKDKYGDAAVVYLKGFVKNGVPEIMNHIESEGMKKIDKDKFASNLLNASESISKGIKAYCKDDKRDPDQKDAELVNVLCESGIGDIGLDVLQALGIDKSRIGNMTPEGFKISYSTMAYVAFMEAYKILAKAEDEADKQQQETMRIVEECSKSVAMIKQYRLEMNELVSVYFSEHMDTFNLGFKEMDESLVTGDTDGFIKGNVEIQSVLNYDVQFKNSEEFESIMNSDKAFKL